MAANNGVSGSLSRWFNIIISGVLVFIFLTPFFSRFLPGEPLERDLRLGQITTGLSALSFLILVVGIWFTSLGRTAKIIICVLAVPFLGLYATMSLFFLVSGPTRLVASTELGRDRYHLVIAPSFGDSWNSYSLFKCSKFGGACKTIDDFDLVETGNHDDMDLAADAEKNLVYVFQDGQLVFTYDANYQDYDKLDDLIIGQYSYELQSKDKLPEVVLSRCNKDTAVNCEVLFTKLLDSPTKDARFTFDEKNRALEVRIEGKPVFQTIAP
jgi:hypothetical protein